MWLISWASTPRDFPEREPPEEAFGHGNGGMLRRPGRKGVERHARNDVKRRPPFELGAVGQHVDQARKLAVVPRHEGGPIEPHDGLGRDARSQREQGCQRQRRHDDASRPPDDGRCKRQDAPDTRPGAPPTGKGCAADAHPEPFCRGKGPSWVLRPIPLSHSALLHSIRQERLAFKKAAAEKATFLRTRCAVNAPPQHSRKDRSRRANREVQAGEKREPFQVLTAILQMYIGSPLSR